MIEAFLIAQSIVIAAFAVVLLLVVRQVGVLSLPLEHYYSQRGARHESPSDGIAVDGALRDERGEVADAAQG